MCQTIAQSEQFQYRVVDSAAGTVDQWFKAGNCGGWVCSPNPNTHNHTQPHRGQNKTKQKKMGAGEEGGPKNVCIL